MNKAVFLDRDGTINEEVGYLRDLAMLRLIPGAAAAVKKLNAAGFMVIVITNQSGVARGYFPESQVLEANTLLRVMLGREGAVIDAEYYCPHHPTAGNSPHTQVCDCRKPATGLIDRAVRDFNIDRRASVMVGDKWSDVELGQRAGLRTVLVQTGFAHDDPGNVRPEHVNDPDLTAHDLGTAVEWILKQALR